MGLRTAPPPGLFILIESGNFPDGLISEILRPRAGIVALDGLICDGEAFAELEALARVKYALPRMLARAVSLVPAYLAAYVSYSLYAPGDIHTDFAVQMQKVCRDLHAQFKMAVEALPEARCTWFTTAVLDPERCRAIAIPESD